MYPYLFGVEALPMYGILLALGLLGAVLLFKFICAKKHVDDDSYTFYSLLGIVSIALGIGGAALFQAFYDFIETGIFEFSGLTFMGGLITGVVSFILGTLIFAKPAVKRNFFKCGSFVAPCIVLGHMFGRLGCFCAGCCYGKPTLGAFGVQFPNLVHRSQYIATGGRAYPTQLFEAAFLALLLVAMLVILLKFDIYKPLLPVYGISYAIFRFLIEFIRNDERGEFIPGLTPSQFQVLVLCIISVTLLILVYVFNIIPFAKAKDKKREEQAPPEE
ncbi:MAG: prolipoprotein diacylglyceryl transferase [Clostridia bacterium]|nr:prolipoprotein diacylglyceryl transferase [Clostridia bacterium]